LPYLELDPRFEVLLDEIVETRLAVDRDRALGGLLFLLSGHRPPMILECTAKNTSGRGFLHECTCRAAPLAARRVDFASRVHPRVGRVGRRARQHLALSLPGRRERWRRIRARL